MVTTATRAPLPASTSSKALSPGRLRSIAANGLSSRRTWIRLCTRLRLGFDDQQRLLDDLLYRSCAGGVSRSIRCFLALGANPNSRFFEFEFPTPFYAAIRHAKPHDVALLITQGAAVAPFHTSALGLAVWRGSHRIVRLVLALGLNPNAPVCGDWGVHWDVPPLLIAIAENQPAIVLLLLRSGADANVVCHDLGRGFYGPMGHTLPCTPLMVAHGIGSPQIARLLRKFGAKACGANTSRSETIFHLPPTLRARSRCPIRSAARKIRDRLAVRVVCEAIEHVRDLDGERGVLLTEACKAGNFQIVRHLLALGANPNSVCVPLPQLVGPKNAIARILLEHGFNGDFQPSGPPLLESIRSGRSDLVKVLLQAGVNPDVVSLQDTPCGFEWTPLMIAILHDELRCARLLLKHGADPSLGYTVTALSGENVAEIFAMSGWKFVAAPQSRTLNWCDGVAALVLPIQIAIMTGSIQALTLLLRHGASIPERSRLEPYLEFVASPLREKFLAMTNRPVYPTNDETIFG